MEENLYKTMYPTGCTSLKIYGLPKIHKTSTPLGLLHQAGTQSLMEWLKSLLRYLRHLVGSHHITYKVCHCTTLYTSAPIDPALDIRKELLEHNNILHDRTVLSVQNITDLLGFCLHNTYFSFQKKIYEQVEGAAVGSLISPRVANLYMEDFEKKALHTASIPQALV